jgi:hypothetical protein
MYAFDMIFPIKTDPDDRAYKEAKTAAYAHLMLAKRTIQLMNPLTCVICFVFPRIAAGGQGKTNFGS